MPAGARSFFHFINFEEARKKNMIVVMKNSASSEEILRVTDALVKKGMQVPVSYTHLDVYKRQVNNRP